MSEAVKQETEEKKVLPPDLKKNIKDIVDIIEAIVVAVVASIFILTLLFRTGFVSGESMLTTMYDGDRYVVSSLFYTPSRSDIIVFEPDLSDTTEEKLYVKRVIGLAGDRIEIKADADNNYNLYINGEIQHEEYLDANQVTKPWYGETNLDENGNQYIDVTVPDGYIFVMGDNRVNSKDSRIIGCVDTRRIVGKVLFRFYPFSKFGTVA